MIVFGVGATRNQFCPSRSIRGAPSSRPSAQAPRISQPSACTLSRTRRSVSSKAPGERSEPSCRWQTAVICATASATRGGKPERSMDEGSRGCDIAMGTLLMSCFWELIFYRISR